MVQVEAETEETTQATSQTQDVDAQWVTLQRAVAAGMIGVLATPMVAVQQQLIPPLAVIGALFLLGLGLTWFRPRAGAIGVGVIAGLWLLLQLANYSLVLVDLTRPSATLFFLITLGMLVLPAAGLVGLVGLLRDTSGRIAVRTLQVAGVAMVGGLVVSLLAGL